VTVPEIPVPEIPAPENITPVVNVTPELNVTPVVNVTVPVTPEPGVETPPAPENITVPVIPENVTPALPANVTAPEAAPAPAVEENQAPTLNTLTPDRQSPQISGTVITWAANATDPEGDTVLYRFFLNGPTTGGSGSRRPAGREQLLDMDHILFGCRREPDKVGIRDGQHAGEDSADAEQVVYFTITAPSRNISGMKFNDMNGNGQKESGEEGLSGWTIQLRRPDGSDVSTITAQDGSYIFENLPLGTYTLSEMIQAGWVATMPEGRSYTVDLRDSDVTERDFGNRLTSYSISGKKFNDLDNNGIDNGEPGLPGWTIQLSSNGNVINTATTALDGSYRFSNLTPGSYVVTEVEQTGWTRTAPQDGSYNVDLSDADVAGRNFGNHGVGSISGTKFFDTNSNGVKDADEPGLSGWTIQLARRGETVNATTTGQDGSYTFRNLQPATYTVSEVAQEGYVQTLPQEGTYTVELQNADVTGRDFGNKGNLSITGVKFYDANGNGVQDQDEPGLPGQEVKLVESGREIASVTTGQDGSYTFSNLVPGTYEVDDPILVTVTTKVKVVVNVPAVSPFTISGVKFNDLNNDGIKQSTEPGIANWDIDLVYVTPGPAPDILLDRKPTDSNGAYIFYNLPPGVYKVSEVARQGWTPTTPAEVTVNIPSTANKVNFGNRIVSPPANQGSILGVKFNDLNKNGNRNSGEPGLQGWTIQLKNASNLTVIKTSTTSSDGSYAFLNLVPGVYVVGEVNQAGWTQSKPAVGPGGQVYLFTLAAGETKQGIDFGNYINNSPPINPTLVSNLPSPQRVGTPIVWTGATDPDGVLCCSGSSLRANVQPSGRYRLDRQHMDLEHRGLPARQLSG
jgi:protocatechuate 3,4-dioxygenase beta subunit